MKEMTYKAERMEELLDSGTYEGYEYAIVSMGTHPCAYIKLPEGHKYYGLGYDDIPIECHGGLTYAENRLNALPENSGWWIGWDYAHCNDCIGTFGYTYFKKWTTSEIFEEIKQVAEQLKHLHEAVNSALFNEVPDKSSAKNMVISPYKVDWIKQINNENFSKQAGKSLKLIIETLNQEKLLPTGNEQL